MFQKNMVTKLVQLAVLLVLLVSALAPSSPVFAKGQQPPVKPNPNAHCNLMCFASNLFPDVIPKIVKALTQAVHQDSVALGPERPDGYLQFMPDDSGGSAGKLR